MSLRHLFFSVAISVLIVSADARAQTVFSSAGANAAGIQATVDAFRASLGVLNPNVAGSFGSGRREINWDAVPNALAAPNSLPANFFNSNSPRGAVFSTPGTGFQVSANAGIALVEFGNIDANYTALFGIFSAQRLFTPIGSNIMDVNFFVPGTLTPAATVGFGSVFTDVDLANTTSIEYFDFFNNTSLGIFFAPDIAGNETLSFLGVSFADSLIGRVRITNGNQILAAGNTNEDLVVMDEFIYGEPLAVPEPTSLILTMLGGITVALRRHKRRRSSNS